MESISKLEKFPKTLISASYSRIHLQSKIYKIQFLLKATKRSKLTTDYSKSATREQQRKVNEIVNCYYCWLWASLVSLIIYESKNIKSNQKQLRCYGAHF